jgi:hypothetical protein
MFVGSFVASMGHVAYEVMSARLGYSAPHISVETPLLDPFGLRLPVDDPFHAGGSAVFDACKNAGCGGDGDKSCLGAGDNDKLACMGRLGAGGDGSSICLAGQVDCDHLQAGTIPVPPRSSPCWCSSDKKKLKFYTNVGCVCDQFAEYERAVRQKEAARRKRAGDPVGIDTL